MFCTMPRTTYVMRRVFPATDMYTKLISSALFAGGAAGLISGLLQLFFVQPVLLHAELYEVGTLVHFGAGTSASANPVVPGPELLRDGLSVLFNILIYCGYAMLLVAAMALAEGFGTVTNGRNGIVWGVAGFVAVQLLPAFSLAPEVPGVAAGDVYDRQVWWGLTVVSASAALWFIAFSKRRIAWVAAVALLLAPHLFGAPEPDYFTGTAPPEVAALFAARSLGSGLFAWSVLGCVAGFFWARAENTGRRRALV